MRIRARIQFLIIGGLHGDDGGDAKDVVGVGAARDVGGGAVEAQENLPVAVGAGGVLQQLAACLLYTSPSPRD